MTEPGGSPVVRLPGVGERFDVVDRAGRTLTLVRRRDGDVELHLPGGALVELDGPTATSVGAFVAGHYVLLPEVADRIAGEVGGLVFDWVRLRPGDRAVGETIRSLQVRQRTGVTIVAILRRPAPLVGPDPDVALQPGDDIVFVCRDTDRDAFARFLRDRD